MPLVKNSKASPFIFQKVFSFISPMPHPYVSKAVSQGLKTALGNIFGVTCL
jgi:hypothetical protein